MQAEWLIQIVLALLTGGVGVKIIEWFFVHNKTLRDELRHEIARLENRIKELDAKVNLLEDEVEQWKGKVEEWRNKYYELQQRHQSALLQLQLKDDYINRLKVIINQLTTRLKEITSDENSRELDETTKEETNELG